MATGDLTPAQVQAALDLQVDAVARSAAVPRRSTIETGRLEEEITFESAPGDTRFLIRLPLTAKS